MRGFSWVLDEEKFLTSTEVRRLLEVVRRRKYKALKKGSGVGVREWFVINVALFTGLRVGEISDLRHGDIVLVSGYSSLIVRNGKGGKPRLVRFGPILRERIKEYLEWKQRVGEPCGVSDHVIISSNTGRAMTTRGLQKIFERTARRAGIEGHSIHHLRHTYASHLYRSSKYNLRLVQKQLGHSSTKITEVYADILKPDVERALIKLYET